MIRQAMCIFTSLLVIGCGSTETDAASGPDTIEQQILHGTHAHSAGFVGALLDDDGGVFCSMALLERRIALTAAHCLRPNGARNERNAFFGDDISADGRVVPVAAGSRYPHYDEETGYGDLALLLLSRDVNEVAATPNIGPLSNMVIGRPVRLVGFGEDEEGWLGRKLERQEPIVALERDSLTYGSTVCGGDSGGPALLEIDGVSLVVGVTASTGRDCRGISRSTRVDPFARWVKDESRRLVRLSSSEPLSAGACSAAGAPHVSLSLRLVALVGLVAAFRFIQLRRGRSTKRRS